MEKATENHCTIPPKNNHGNTQYKNYKWIAQWEVCRSRNTIEHKIKEIAGQKICSSTACIKCKKYIGELSHNNRGDKPTI